MTIVEILETLRNTAGTLDKKKIIQDNESDLLTQIFQDAYDESRKYNVKKYEVIESDFEPLHIEDNYHIFHNGLIYLAERKVTGNEAVEFIGKIIGQFDITERWILDGILRRNLKVGVSLDNFNDAMGIKTIKKYEVALADKFFDLKPEKQNEIVMSCKYLISRKLDGVRCTIHYDPTDYSVKFISRQGKEFTTLDNLKPAIRNILHYANQYVVLDGEVCITDENGNEDFRGLMSEVTRKNYTIEHPKFKWFDILTLGEFEGYEESKPFTERVSEMMRLYELSAKPNEVEVLEQELLWGWDQFNEWTKKVEENGWEGFMLRKNVPYKSGRSKDLLKVKKMQDAEYVVEGIVKGKIAYNEGGTKEYDAVSSLIINHKGNEVYVGSGLSKEQRLYWFEHPEAIIGKTVTIQYFEETKDKKTGAFSLRFPILKYVYDGDREV